MKFFQLMGIVPLGIGLTVLAALWIGGGPFAMFPMASDLPGAGGFFIVFRIIGSFVALAFILQGAALLSGQLTDPNRIRALGRDSRFIQQGLQDLFGAESLPKSPSSVGYQCTSCGAKLDRDAEVSPHGDAKCQHCGQWFNIHNPA